MIFGCVCDLWYNIGGIEALLLGEKPLNILPLELFPCQCVLLCPLLPVVWAHKVHCGWCCSQSHLNCGYDISWP